eukprot:s2086_g12.t1
MRHYVGGKWGFSLIFGIYGSVFPYAFTMAVVNATLTFGVSISMEYSDGFNPDPGTTEMVATLMAIFSSVMMFILTFRSDIAYERWWEGGTLLQKTRGEWFNAYSSLVAFSSARPELQRQVMEFHHLLARLMSLLFCCALQQVSPSKDRPFEILDTQGIELESLLYLESTRDKVEIILQWIQRSIVLRQMDGVLPVAPPVLSRAFQELSRGIVNLQNARKIADFPFPYPYAQVSILMLLLHWGLMPFWCSMLLSKTMAAATSFVVIFFLWCLNFIALQLEAPFGDEPNDLPMDQMILDWNNSLCTLLSPRSQRPPAFEFDPATHDRWITSLSNSIPSMMVREEDEETEEDCEEEDAAIATTKSNLSDHGAPPLKIAGKYQMSSAALARQTVLRQDGRGDGLARHNSPQPDLTWEGPRKGMSSARRLKADMTIAKTLSDVSPKISNDLSLGGNDERAAERQQPLPAPSPGPVALPQAQPESLTTERL